MVSYVRDLCSACGNLRTVCSDPDRVWYPQRTMCYATANREVTQRRVLKRNEDVKQTADALHPMDGMGVWVSEDDLTPDDDFC